jgi:hypothetical protein
MARNKGGRRGGQRNGKTVLNSQAKRRRLIKRALAAWLGIILVAGIVRACTIRMGQKSPTPARKDVLPYDPLRP